MTAVLNATASPPFATRSPPSPPFATRSPPSNCIVSSVIVPEGRGSVNVASRRSSISSLSSTSSLTDAQLGGSNVNRGSSRWLYLVCQMKKYGAPIYLGTQNVDLPVYDQPVSFAAGDVESKLRSEVFNLVQKECSALFLEVNGLIQQEIFPLKQEMKAMTTILQLDRTDEGKVTQASIDEKVSTLSDSINEELSKIVSMINASSNIFDKNFDNFKTKQDQFAAALRDLSLFDKSFDNFKTKQDQFSAALRDLSQELVAQRSAITASDDHVRHLQGQLERKFNNSIGEIGQCMEDALTRFENDRRRDYKMLSEMLQTEQQERSREITNFEERLLGVENALKETTHTHSYMVSKKARDKNLQPHSPSQYPQTLDQYRADLSFREFQS